MSRRNPDWLSAWLEYSSAWESPERFRLWSGIAAVSAALQRRVWTFVRGQFLHANTYILLVGPPGSGKGNAMKYLAQWLKDQDKVHMAPDGLTKRSFYDALESSFDIPEGGLGEKYHSLSAFIEELGVFLRAGDNDFIYSICHVYDCPEQFVYKTHSAGQNDMEKVSFSMLSAVTPKGLRDIFTEEAMELGISARTVLVYADDYIDIEIFGKREKHEQMEKDLKYDLRSIGRMVGEYQFNEEAAHELKAWSKSRFAPIPKDPRFEHYSTRRFVQIVKLCMICAAAKRDEPIILIDDVNRAREIILECESVMPKAIITLGANPMLAQQQALIKHINLTWEKLKRGVQEFELHQIAGRDVPPHLMGFLLDELAHGKWIKCIGSSPDRIYYPRGQGPEQK